MADKVTRGIEVEEDQASGEIPAPLDDVSGEPTPLRPGDEVGPYRLIRIRGRGGMATVFEAEHQLIGRTVALKVLHPDAAENANAVQRFFQEAQAINRLHHEHLIEITDVSEGVDGSPPFMVMELLDGVPLDRLISSRGPLPPARAADIGRQICDAMDAVHRAGIIHRDLKPENVILLDGTSREPRVKLLDFGVAKFLAAEENALRTDTGALVGTPEYMAPEQVQGRPVDERTDIYALGGILYEMLTGSCPFYADQLGQVLRMQLEDNPPAPSVAAGGLAEGELTRNFDRLVLGCLAKKPEERPQSMAALAELLGRVVDGLDTAIIAVPTVFAPENTANVPMDRLRPPRRWPWLVGAALIAILVLGLGVWLARS